MHDDQLSRFDRIVAMFIHLQSRKVVKAQELADRFQVSLRTVYRDIRSLEASGVPITGEAGIGYSLVEGYRLPPIMFTREEAGSFVAAEKLMQKFSDKTLGAYYQSAMFKVKSVLKGSTKERVAALEKQVWVNTSQQLFNEHTPDALDILLDSIAEKKQVHLQYQTNSSNDINERIIEPIGVFIENNYWYVMAYCHLRADYRQFRTDRMMKIDRTSHPFSRVHPNMEEFKKPEDPRSKEKVIIRVDKEIARYIKAGSKYYGLISEKASGDRIEMTFMTDANCDGLCRWFLMFGDQAEIVEPDSIRERINDLIEKIRENINALA
jgi:predicted DNA-binding transcriptional regulator YafY